MKILQVVHGYPPQSKGGTELYTSTIIRKFRQEHEVKVIFPGRSLIDAKSDIINFPSLYSVDIYNRYPIYSKNSIFNGRANNMFLDIIKKCKPHVIHFQHLAKFPFSLLEIALSTTIPTVVSLHDFWFNCPRIHYYNSENEICENSECGNKCCNCNRRNVGLRRTIKSFKDIFPDFHPKRKIFFNNRYVYTRSLLNRTNTILAPSKFVRQKMEEEGVNKRSITVLPLGIQPSGKRKKIHPRKKLRLCFVGTLKHHKGIYDLINAFQFIDVCTFDLHIYGSGSRTELLRYINERGLKNIVFHGEFDPKYRYDIYLDYDALVIPSRCYETYSFVAREALLCGIPIIAPKHSVFLELIKQSHNGYLFDPKDIKSLVNSIKTLLNAKFTNIYSKTQSIPTTDEHCHALLDIYNSLNRK